MDPQRAVAAEAEAVHTVVVEVPGPEGASEPAVVGILGSCEEVAVVGLVVGVGVEARQQLRELR